MEAQRFDELAQALANFASRRRSVGGLLAGLLALVVPGLDPEAARRGKSQSRTTRRGHDDAHRNEGDHRRAQDERKKGGKSKKKKVTLCHNGRTIRVSKKAKKKYLHRGATLGACPTGGDETLPLTLESVDAATRDALWSAANQSADYNAIADHLGREEQMSPTGAFDVQRLRVRQEFARTVLTAVFANTQGRQAVLAFGVEATGEEWAYAFVSLPDGSTALVYIEGATARQVDAEKAARASVAGRHARFSVGAERVNVCEWLGTLCSDISDPCFQCKAICSITVSVVTGIGAYGCAMAVGSLCGPFALACAAGAFVVCAGLSAMVVGTPCFEGCKLLNYCKVCKSLGEGCSGDADCCDNPVIRCIGGVCQVPGPTCAEARESCSISNDCCHSLSCEDNHCDGIVCCGQQGQSCGSGCDCCGTLSCETGVCGGGGGTCSEVRESCSTNGDCCGSLVCEDNLCDGIVCCGQQGQACSGSCGCCGNLNCENGVCGGGTCGTAVCNGTNVNTCSDLFHCGGCNRYCGENGDCVGGKCCGIYQNCGVVCCPDDRPCVRDIETCECEPCS